MKHMKRIFALALAVMMLLSLAITASAAEGDITISVTESASGASVAGCVGISGTSVCGVCAHAVRLCPSKSAITSKKENSRFIENKPPFSVFVY